MGRVMEEDIDIDIEDIEVMSLDIFPHPKILSHPIPDMDTLLVQKYDRLLSRQQL